MEYKLGEKARCAVIGYGSWATAIVSLLVKNEKEVWWYVRNADVLEGLLTDGISSNLYWEHCFTVLSVKTLPTI